MINSNSAFDVDRATRAASLMRSTAHKHATSSQTVVLDGDSLTLQSIASVALHGAPVVLCDNADVRRRIHRSRQHIADKVEQGQPVYGVTTGFGGMANIAVAAEQASELQQNLMRFTMVGAGGYLPREDVRAAMLARVNSHVRGASGLRLAIIEQMLAFLNADAVPLVREYGSIGASGDLSPLAQIMGAVCGLSHHYQVDFRGSQVDCLSVLEALDLQPLQPLAKEGLAMINGTSVMTGTAALCALEARRQLALSLHLHSLYIQALGGSNESFHPFVHQHKAHPGQLKIAAIMLELLEGSALSRNELDGHHEARDGEPLQDRYSMRCLAQFLGPVLDTLDDIGAQIEREANSANDNPLIDPDTGNCYHSGNFLGQYIGVSMDRLRQMTGLVNKHLDTQIALLMAPEFSNGLPASLTGNSDNPTNMGLKGLQISGNSIMPLLTWYGQPLVDRFPTHAEQFNQNINSQGFGAANLARQQQAAARQYLAIASMVGIQALDLRSVIKHDTCDPRPLLADASRPLYEAIRSVLDVPIRADKPYVRDDRDQFFDRHIELLANDLAEPDGHIYTAIEKTLEAL